MPEDTFSYQVLMDAVESLPLDDQSMLVGLINKRIMEKRRAELISEVGEVREALRKGEVKRGTVEDLYNQWQGVQ